MRIKIHTYNFTSNYGAILQAFSLGYYLNSLSDTGVTFNSYHPYNFKYYEFVRPLISKKKPKKVFGQLEKNIKILSWRNYYLKELAKNSSPLFEDKKISVYGSDEIWNFLNPYYGFSEYFFGGDNNEKKIAYAVSIGKATFNDLKPNFEKNNLFT